VNIPFELSRHLGVSESKAIAEVKEPTLDGVAKAVASKGAKVVSTFCTNLVAAQRAGFWERLYDVIVLETAPTVVWDMPGIAGVPSRSLAHWGKLFALD
jgi:maleate isomerase